jgi:hypothetical protein
MEGGLDLTVVLRVDGPATRAPERVNARGIGLVMGRTLLEMEGKEHVRHRDLIAPFLGPARSAADWRRESGASRASRSHRARPRESAIVGLAFRSPDRLPVRFG